MLFNRRSGMTPEAISDRQALLRTLFHVAEPNTAAAILFATDPALVTPRDRYLFRRAHPNPTAALNALAATQPEAATAWGWQSP